MSDDRPDTPTVDNMTVATTDDGDLTHLDDMAVLSTAGDDDELAAVVLTPGGYDVLQAPLDDVTWTDGRLRITFGDYTLVSGDDVRYLMGPDVPEGDLSSISLREPADPSDVTVTDGGESSSSVLAESAMEDMEAA